MEIDVDVESVSPRGLKRKAIDAVLPPEAPRRIQALPQDVVNKIAAGEIIVAPVHALKELMENAVDAGSTSLEILVKDGGLKLLQITDNGHGINRDDMPILCERFTTSKLKTFEDLTSIGTYGFRGEALASISHIAHLQVTTKTKQSNCAWRAFFSGGKLTPQKPGQSPDPKACAGREGTQITVEDLFYNMPTRRRAFRSASEEYSKILDLVGRYAVHCSGVAFSCKKHGDSSMGISVAQAAGTVDRIRNIHGSAVTNELIRFEVANDRWGFKSHGWASNANYHVKKLVLLLFINGRSVESSAIKKAIENTYTTFLPKGGHPFVYLSLEIEPARVDVNVHPTKKEVNFLNEDEIIQIICDEIRESLGKVDTSRTFLTQTLLPGVKIPTISADSPGNGSPQKQSYKDFSKDTPIQKKPHAHATTPKPYENNLVRTDSKLRKITSMMPALGRRTSSHPEGIEDDSENIALDDEQKSYNYTLIDREPTICRLTTVKELRTAVRSCMHNGLTDILSTLTFVGIVDEHRRIAAIQSGVKLFLADYGMLCNEYFYQIGLTDFGNFGSIRLSPPLSLKELLNIGIKLEQERAALDPNEDTNGLDWDTLPDKIAEQLMGCRAMLLEYFSLEISSDGQLVSLPLLVKGYNPSMAKLPQFLIRLGPCVDWSEEKACFHTFLRELAAWYVPEALPAAQAPHVRAEGENVAASNTESQHGDESDPEFSARRAELAHSLENTLFPAFRARLVATKGMLRGVVEIANLKGLYRVFERC